MVTTSNNNQKQIVSSMKEDMRWELIRYIVKDIKELTGFSGIKLSRFSVLDTGKTVTIHIEGLIVTFTTDAPKTHKSFRIKKQ